MTQQPSRHDLIRLGVLLSGGGTTLQNLADQIRAGTLNASIEVVISSKPDAYGLVRARDLGLPSWVVARKDFDSPAAMSAIVFERVREHRVGLVCLAGYLSLLPIPDDFVNRVVNIHPALLPAFGGKGMYGKRVHEAVLAAGCKVSGCSVHYCDQAYDTGPIIVQRSCPVLENDTPETLAQRVFGEECIAYPQAISLIAAGRVRIEGGRARVLAEADEAEQEKVRRHGMEKARRHGGAEARREDTER